MGHGHDRNAYPRGRQRRHILRPRSLLAGIGRHPCCQARHTVRGFGVDSTGRTPQLWRFRLECGPRPNLATRSRQSVHRHDFQQEIAFLGVQGSASYVREPQGNGIAERFVRILEANHLWIRSFQTNEELRLALLAFKETYNRQWRFCRHGYRSPAQVREKQKTQRPWRRTRPSC